MIIEDLIRRLIKQNLLKLEKILVIIQRKQKSINTGLLKLVVILILSYSQ